MTISFGCPSVVTLITVLVEFIIMGSNSANISSFFSRARRKSYAFLTCVGSKAIAPRGVRCHSKRRTPSKVKSYRETGEFARCSRRMCVCDGLAVGD